MMQKEGDSLRFPGGKSLKHSAFVARDDLCGLAGGDPWNGTRVNEIGEGSAAHLDEIWVWGTAGGGWMMGLGTRGSQRKVEVT